jgi:hypothetical protein
MKSGSGNKGISMFRLFGTGKSDFKGIAPFLHIFAFVVGIAFLWLGIVKVDIIPKNLIQDYIFSSFYGMQFFFPIIFIVIFVFLILSYWYPFQKLGLAKGFSEIIFSRLFSWQAQLFCVFATIFASMLFSAIVEAYSENFLLGFYLIFNALLVFNSKRMVSLVARQVSSIAETKPMPETLSLEKVEIPKIPLKKMKGVAYAGIMGLVIGLVFFSVGIFLTISAGMFGLVFVFLGLLAFVGALSSLLAKTASRITIAKNEICVFSEGRVLTFETQKIARIELAMAEHYGSKGNSIIAFFLPGQVFGKTFFIQNDYEDAKKIVSSSSFFVGEEGAHGDTLKKTIFLPESQNKS